MKSLKQFRQAKKLLVKDIAEQLGISRITLWQYENDKRKPSFETLVKLAKIYGCKVDDFAEAEQRK